MKNFAQLSLAVLLGASSMIFSAAPASAAKRAYEPVVSGLEMTRSEAGAGSLSVSYTVDRDAWQLPSNTEVILTPVVSYAGGEVTLTPLVLAGRNAYLAHKRNDDLPKGLDLERAKGGALQRSQTVAWQPGMERCELSFRTETRGCRCREEGRGDLDSRLAMDFAPKHFELIIPRAQLAALEKDVKDVVKTRSVSKSAHVNYKVGSTVLLPDFESNPAELAAIVATIDSVRSDKDLTVDGVEIHGYASPEGSYALNTRLAAGRTEALRKYVDARYNFGKLLTTTSTPEDWAGLREWVAASSLHDRDALLRVIDSKLSPDAKDEELQKGFPNNYKILLWEVYPKLRRSDYSIRYTVCNFTKPEVIAEMLRTNPSKLSYEEVMMLARTYKEGSAEREALALKSAELFPTDERAQLQGAFVALGRNDLKSAAKMLEKAGQSPLADYGRGVLEIYRENKAAALPLLRKAAAAKIEGAKEALSFAEEMK